MIGSDDDIDFMVRCIREDALVNISYVLQAHLETDFAAEAFDQYSSPSTDHPYENAEWSNLNETRVVKKTNNFNRNESLSTPQAKTITTANNHHLGAFSNQIKLLSQVNCTSGEFKYTFNNRDLNYAGRDKNPVFVVRVYSFQTPITIQIAFSRRSRVQLLHFFITFFGCLLSLLTIAFVTWKSKQRYDRYRRQRQIVIQMEHMASRPFTRILVDITKKKHAADETKELTDHEDKINVHQGAHSFFNAKQDSSGKSPRKSSRRKLRKFMEDRKNSLTNNLSLMAGSTIKERLPMGESGSSPKIMPVAIEPLSNNKTGVLTCLLKMPQGDLNYTPKGSSPFMLASAYVQINQSSSFINVAQNKNDNDDFLNDKLENKTEI